MRVFNTDDLSVLHSSLCTPGHHIAEFEDGEIAFFCGPSAFKDYSAVCGLSTIGLFSDEYVGDFITSESADRFLSIGLTKNHNQARKAALIACKGYTTCPLALPNDSFATDRFGGGPMNPAIQGTFPDVVILDWQLCADNGKDVNVFGLGECLGLLTSVRDYTLIHLLDQRCQLLSFIDEILRKLIASWSNTDYYSKQVAILGATLSIKALLIRLMGTNAIIAGCDHLIAYELERCGLSWPHGKLVFAGVLLSLPLLYKDPVPIAGQLLEISSDTGIFTVEDHNQLTTQNLTGILLKAHETRPGRSVALDNMNRHKAERVARSVRGMFDVHKGLF